MTNPCKNNKSTRPISPLRLPPSSLSPIFYMPFCVFLYLYLETLKIDFSCVCYLSIAMQQITPSLAVKTTNVITSKFLGQKDRGELSWVFLTQSVSLSGSQACWLQAGLPGRPGPDRRPTCKPAHMVVGRCLSTKASSQHSAALWHGSRVP